MSPSPQLSGQNQPISARSHEHARGAGLALLLTPGVSVSHWDASGYLEREAAYYRALGSCVGRVTFISDGASSAGLHARLGSIRLVDVGGYLLPLRRVVAVLRMDRRTIVKTNQLSGVLAPLVARLCGRRVVARGGYVASEPWRHASRPWLSRARDTLVELALVWTAARVLVTSPEAAAYLRERYRVPARRVVVVPNFVEVERFMVQAPKRPGLVAIVGRLTPEKRVAEAIDAVARVPRASLRVIGDGAERASLQRRARERGTNAEFVGVVQHDRLPAMLAESDVYLIASRFEGHPKSLLEAMAAGLACVGVPAPGIRSVIDDGVTGILARDGSASAIADALARVLGDASLRERLGSAARAYAQRMYARDVVVARECAAYREAGWLEL